MFLYVSLSLCLSLSLSLCLSVSLSVSLSLCVLGQARSYYEFVADAEVVEVDFIVHPDFPYMGVSPDGLVGDKGMIEIKCPQPKTHIEYLAAKKLPSKYRWQVQGQLWVAKRDFCDFVSFHPDCEHQLIVRVEASQKDWDALKERAEIANEAVEALIKQIKESA